MRDLTYPPIIVSAKVLFRLLGLRFQMRGLEHVPTTGGAVLAVNHVSYVDFVLGGYAAQPSGRLVRFMSKRELFDHRWVGPLMRSLHHIEVDRGAGQRSYATGVEYLRAGELVGIFPEATISRSMDLKDFKTGTVRMAAEAGVPVVPLILWGTQLMYTKDRPRDFSRGTTIAMTAGEPLHPTGDDPVAETAALRTVMRELLDETVAAYPLDPAGRWWAPARLGGAAPTPAEADRLDAEERARRAEARARRTARDS